MLLVNIAAMLILMRWAATSAILARPPGPLSAEVVMSFSGTVHGMRPRHPKDPPWNPCTKCGSFRHKTRSCPGGDW